MTHDSKCFSPCVFHRQQSNSFVPSHKCQHIERLSIEEGDLAVYLFEGGVSLGQVS